MYDPELFKNTILGRLLDEIGNTEIPEGLFKDLPVGKDEKVVGSIADNIAVQKLYVVLQKAAEAVSARNRAFHGKERLAKRARHLSLPQSEEMKVTPEENLEAALMYDKAEAIKALFAGAVHEALGTDCLNENGESILEIREGWQVVALEIPKELTIEDIINSEECIGGIYVNISEILKG